MFQYQITKNEFDPMPDDVGRIDSVNCAAFVNPVPYDESSNVFQDRHKDFLFWDNEFLYKWCKLLQREIPLLFQLVLGGVQLIG